MDDVVKSIVKMLKSNKIDTTELIKISMKTIEYDDDDWKELIGRVILEIYSDDIHKDIKDMFRYIT